MTRPVKFSDYRGTVSKEEWNDLVEPIESTTATDITIIGTVEGDTISDGTASLASGSLTSAVNGTFSGTVQAEQLTSTDDIDASGTITGTTLTDGTAVLSGGNLTSLNTLSYNTGYTETESETTGTTFWDSDNHCLTTVYEWGAKLQHGFELYTHGSDEGNDFLEGAAVSVSGGTGNRVIFELTDCSDNESADNYIGILTTPPDSGNRIATREGCVRGIDTTGAASFGSAETWAEGQWLYVDPDHPGYLTNVLPSAPTRIVRVGTITNRHKEEGVIELDRWIYTRIEDLSNVDGEPLVSDGQIMVWNSASGFFNFDYNINDYLTTASGVNSYLKLDCSNDPLTGDLQLNEDLLLLDNKTITLGDGNDSSIYYDGTNLVVDPLVGSSGVVDIPGGIEIGDGSFNWHNAGDVGVASVDFGNGAGSAGASLTVKNSVGKAGILIAGTVGSGFGYDNVFAILKETREDIDNDNAGSGTVVMWFNASAQVGIGTNNPSQKLHVKTASQVVSLFESTSDPCYVGFKNSSDSNYIASTSDKFQITDQAGTVSTSVDTTNKRFGIGVAAPTQKLHVVTGGLMPLGNEVEGITWSFNGTGYFSSIDTTFDSVTIENNKLMFNVCDKTVTGQTRVMTLQGDGNVGIGTTSPDFSLEISGQTKTDGGVIRKVNRITTSTVLDSTYHQVFCNTNAGDITVTLPASPTVGQEYRIANSGASGNYLTIDENGNKLLGEIDTFTLFDGDVLTIAYEETEGWY